MVLLASDITSIRFAVKLAMYKTPRTSSKARSDASPPIGTTVPNVAASATLAVSTAAVNANANALRNIRELHPPAGAFQASGSPQTGSFREPKLCLHVTVQTGLWLGFPRSSPAPEVTSLG